MNLRLITLSGEMLNEEVYETILPTASGEIAIYPGHEPLVTLAVPGVVMVRRNKGDHDSRRELFAINGGVVEIEQGAVRVLVDEAEAADDIVEAEAEAALLRAQELRDQADTAVELSEAYKLIERHQVRLKVAGLRRRHHQQR